MGFDLIDEDYSPQSLAPSSHHYNPSEVEDMNFAEIDSKNCLYQIADGPQRCDNQDSFGMFPLNTISPIEDNSDIEDKLITHKINRVHRSTVGRPCKSYDSSGSSPRGRSSRNSYIYQSPSMHSPSKTAPYRGGRKKEEPPPSMTQEEKKKWDKERIKKDNHNKIEKRRRYKINDCISIIGRMLPPYEFDQLNKKGAILQTAIEYIKMLQNSEVIKNKVCQENKKLKEANNALQMQLETLMKEPVVPFNQNHLIMTSDQLQQLINKSSHLQDPHCSNVKKEGIQRETNDFSQTNIQQSFNNPNYNTNFSNNNFNNNPINNNIYNIDPHPKNLSDPNNFENFYKNTYVSSGNEMEFHMQQVNNQQISNQQLNNQQFNSHQAPAYECIDLNETVLNDDFSALSSAFSCSTTSENIGGIEDLDLSFFATFSESSIGTTSDEASSS